MSINVEKLTRAFEQSGAEDNKTNNDRVLPELNKERIKTNLEPLNEQISNLTQSLSQLIDENSAKTTPTVNSLLTTHGLGPRLSENQELRKPRLSMMACKANNFPRKVNHAFFSESCLLH